MEIDTHLDAAVYIANRYQLSLEQRYWFAFLNACCETTPTALYLLRKFPVFPTSVEGRLRFKRFVTEKRDILKAQYDVRWIIYQLPMVFDSYCANVGNLSQFDAIKHFLNYKSAAERYDHLLSDFHIYKFGTYTLFLWTELIHYLSGADAVVKLDFRTNHSVRNGLMYALGIDGLGLFKKGEQPTTDVLQLLNDGFSGVYENIQKLKISPRHKTLWAIETTLCTYNKYNHGRRWLGYYCERQRKEIEFFQNVVGEDESMLWEYRRSTFPQANCKELS